MSFVMKSPSAEQKRDQKSKPIAKERSFEYVLKSGLAGGLAGCAAKTVVAPLDRIKILFQTSTPEYTRYTGSWAGFLSAISVIRRCEGWMGLFKGHSATLLQKFPYSAINFLAYEQIRATIIPSKDKETPLRRLLSGSLAGCISIFFTYPLELVRIHYEPGHTRAGLTATAVAADTGPASHTISRAFYTSFPQFGLANFYRGFSPTLLGMLPYAGMSFFIHDIVGDWLRHPSLAPYTIIPQSAVKSRANRRSYTLSERPQLVLSAELLAGALAGVIAQTTSYPFEVIRRRMQVGNVMHGGHNLGIVSTCYKIWAENGFRGFWVGLTIGYIKVVPMVATSFLVYERLKWTFGV
ncbi:Mitochondrial carrier protein LEU5 [Penicillium atrosanguineum]|nr:Mitochondrial carrier protein LEU5 [Penicillium atrosanguineum]